MSELTNQDNTALSRKEFANRLVERLNGSGDFPYFAFDALRFQLTTNDGESIKLADFYTEHLARYANDKTINSDWIFEELRSRLTHREEVRPEGAGRFDYKIRLTPNGPQIVWPRNSQSSE
ncbi:hypothetical protein [Lacipirellula sp.]|uniref:hypothetical protein n=1 Tax=Lacipirellula sp. TaxID=2691419 RepID=UPI003D0B1674